MSYWGLSRASFYYQPVGESSQNLLYMRLIDEQYTKTPFYGVPRLTVWASLSRACCQSKVVWARLMTKMGLACDLSAVESHGVSKKPSKTYPYLLKGLSIIRPQLGLGDGYNLHSLEQWVCLSRRSYGLVLPVCVVLGTVKLTRRILLFICT